jgi:hypothetical protein
MGNLAMGNEGLKSIFLMVSMHRLIAPFGPFRDIGACAAIANNAVVPFTVSDLQNLPYVQMTGKD